jgi:hypothetical protein
MLKAIPSYRDVLSVFGGYNHNLRIGEGEFYDMKNLSSAKYPVLSPRVKRGKFVFPNDILAPDISGMLVKGDDLYYVHGNKLYKNDAVVTELTESSAKRRLISMGAQIIVTPDNVVVDKNGAKTFLDYSYICESENKTSDTSVVFSPCNLDGTATEEGKVSSYIKISIKKDGSNVYLYPKVRVGDGLTISGVISEWIEGITTDSSEAIEALNSIHVVQNIKDMCVIIKGNLSMTFEQKCIPYEIMEDGGFTQVQSSITFARKMPKMDFIIESGNRLWGCRYGAANNGETVNEIYASKLGDPTNWNCFDGISSDSYVASVGTDGAFTGAITYMGVPIFFKENCIHKIYGNFPSDFQIQDTACSGVQDGCAESLAIVNGTLFYKSRTAVCAYDGSLPTEVSAALGDKVYDNAAAGALGNKYYISMRDVDSVTEEYSLFVLDTAKGMWYKEDRTQATKFVTRRNNLYYLDYATKHIKMVHSESGADTEMDDISWEAVTGIIGVDTPGKKYISGLEFRMRLALDSIVRIYAEYDSCGEWEQLYVKTGDKLSSTVIPLRPKRCDHLRLKIIGIGEAELYSITKTITNGGT